MSVKHKARRATPLRGHAHPIKQPLVFCEFVNDWSSAHLSTNRWSPVSCSTRGGHILRYRIQIERFRIPTVSKQPASVKLVHRPPARFRA